MSHYRFLGALSSKRSVVWAGAGLLLASSMAVNAATEIKVWHTLNAHNKNVFDSLVKDFNKQQKDVKVVLTAFESQEAIEAALAMAGKPADQPHLVQLDDQRAPDDIAKRSYIQPMYTLLAQSPIKGTKWFLSEGNTLLRDAKGRLLAFPYMVDVPVMFYNINAFKKAGIQPAVPQRSWSGLQDQLVNLANKGSRKCPLTSDQPVSINLENLAAVNNQPYTLQSAGGPKAKKTATFHFDTMYVRHLSLMISWVRTELMVKPKADDQATTRFANNECGVLLSDSGNLGWFKDKRGLDFAISGLPYYAEITKTPGAPFAGGSALWAIKGHGKEANNASVQLLTWLAGTERAASWYQKTGFLPLTQQAFAATDDAYYTGLGQWRQLVAVYAEKPSAAGQGFRVNNYPRIKTMFQSTLDRALSGQEPAITALKFASTEAGKIMQER